MKIGFFESISGDKSSSRLIGFIIIMFALIENIIVLCLGSANIIQSAVAAGTLFLTIAGPAMAFLFVQKKQELNNTSSQPPQPPQPSQMS